MFQEDDVLLGGMERREVSLFADIRFFCRHPLLSSRQRAVRKEVIHGLSTIDVVGCICSPLCSMYICRI